MLDSIATSVQRVRQQASHEKLIASSSGVLNLFGTRHHSIDALIVPTSRGAKRLTHATRLAADLGILLVLLCSGRTKKNEALDLVRTIPGCRALIIDLPAGFTHSALPRSASLERFATANAHRISDLSIKRNIGLLLALSLGWRKILFLDDDIIYDDKSINPKLAKKVSRRLNKHQIAGLACEDFPDNSVTCHARRLAGLEQGIFISGGALGVNLNHRGLELSHFPNIYNEDWFFFSARSAERKVAQVGTVVQERYDPYSKRRARREEFGDLLAEGLYALFEIQGQDMPMEERLAQADTTYWTGFLEARKDSHSVTIGLLAAQVPLTDASSEAARALGSLRAADWHLDKKITAQLCVEFLAQWQEDQQTWAEATQDLGSAGTISEALFLLGFSDADWHSVGQEDRRSSSTLLNRLANWGRRAEPPISGHTEAPRQGSVPAPLTTTDRSQTTVDEQSVQVSNPDHELAQSTAA